MPGLGLLLLLLIIVIVYGVLKGAFSSTVSGEAIGSLAKVASDLNLELHSTGPSSMQLEGMFRGYRIQCDLFNSRHLAKVTLVSPNPISGSIRPQTAETELKTTFGDTTDLLIGVTELDDGLEIDFPDQPGVRRFLKDVVVRQELVDLLEVPFYELHLTPRAISVRWHEQNGAPTGESLKKMMNLLYRLSERASAGATEIHGDDAVPQAPPGHPQASEVVPAVGPARSPSIPKAASASSVATTGVHLSVGSGLAASVAPSGPEVAQPVMASKASVGGTGRLEATEGTGQTQTRAMDFNSGVKALLSGALSPKAFARVFESQPERLDQAVGFLGDFQSRAPMHKALAAFGAGAVPALVAHGTDLLLAYEIRSVLQDMGPAAGPALLAQLERVTDSKQLAFVLDMLTKVSVEGAKETIGRFLKHDDPSIRHKAEQTLIDLGCSRKEVGSMR